MKGERGTSLLYQAGGEREREGEGGGGGRELSHKQVLSLVQTSKNKYWVELQPYPQPRPHFT